MIIQTITILKGEATVINHVLDPIIPAGIAGWTIRFALKASYDDVSPLIDVAMTITDTAACTSTVTLTHAQTNITPDTYYFDIWRTNAGFETPLTTGPFIIEPAVRY